MDNFIQWKKERRKFLILITVLSVIFFLSLPISIGLFPKLMNMAPFGFFTLAWILAFSQIVMTWLIGYLYWYKMKRLDDLLLSMRQEDKR